MIIDLFVNNITAFISSVGYWGMFFLMALESTMFPLPSELVMPFAGFLVANGTFEFWTALIVSTIGCLAGSLFSYYLGYYGGIPFVRKFGRYFLINEHHLKKSEEWFAKRGDITILIGRFIPGIRHVISIPAGVGRMNLFEFSMFTIIGAGIWNAILLWLGYILEKNWQLVYHYTEYIDMFIIFILTIALVYYIAYIIRNRRS
ncbi:MAG: DedA family protein [Nanoarchaeota archaeon]|nr:DedA family protein [Nanoarchaeota archaeon]